MLIIGLTGSLGTGKTTVAGMFGKLGAKVLDADKISRELLGPRGACFKKVVRVFGPGIVSAGTIDRRKLAEVVFRSPRDLTKLTAIIHPAVVKELKRRIAGYRRQEKKAIVVIDAPLLIEAGINDFSDILVVVKASRRLQIGRVTQRGKITKSEAARRIKAQMPIAKKIEMADIVIDNRGNLNQTKKQTEEIWQRLLRKRQKT